MRPLFILTILFTGVFCFAQNETYTGFVYGPADQRLLDPNISSIRYPVSIDGGFMGVSIRREINSIFSIESGYLYYGGSASVIIDDRIRTTLPGISGNQIPLKTIVQIPVFRDRLFYYGYFGGRVCFSEGGRSGSGASIRFWPGDNEVVVTEYREIRDNYILLSGGTGFRWKVIEEMTLSLDAGFSYGFSELRSYHIEHYFNDELKGTYETYSRGENIYLLLELSYPVTRMIRMFRRAKDEFKEDHGIE